MTLVLDSNVVLRACVNAKGFNRFREERLVAPPLMWSEFRSALHEAHWRGEISAQEATDIRGSLQKSPVRSATHRRLDEEAWLVAEELGLAKTYDAEYMALARLLRCRLVTLDMKLHRGAARLGFVIGPDEL